MKNFYTLCVMALLANGVFAGNSGGIPSIEERMKQIAELNKQAKSQATKTDAIIYVSYATRHDVYNDVNSAWQFGDSSLSHLNAIGSDTDLVRFQYDNQASVWVDAYNTIYHRNAANQIIDGIYQTWSPTHLSFVSTSKSTLTYSAAGAQESFLSQNWDTLASQWINVTQTLYTNDANGNVLSVNVQNWDVPNSAWLNVSKTENTYTNNNKTNTVVYHWTAGAWTNYSKSDLTYNSDNNILTNLTQTWDIGTSTWINSTNSLYSYTGAVVDSQLTKQWVSGAWQNASRFVYAYSNGNQTKNRYDLWDTGTNSWRGFYSNEFGFDSNHHKTLEVDSGWNSTTSMYVPQSKTIQTYDGNGNNIETEQSIWNSTTTVFDPSRRTTDMYDSHNSHTYQLIEAYHSGYKNQDQFFWYYQAFTVSGIEETQSIRSLTVYPNPVANGKVYTQFSLERESSVTINMYNNDGKLISTQTITGNTGNNTVQLNVNGLSSGAYHIQFVNHTDNTCANAQVMVN